MRACSSVGVVSSGRSSRRQILWNWAVFLTVLLGHLVQRIFFGPLRPIEREVRSAPSASSGSSPQRLSERSWYAITETLLALTIFRDEFDASFIVLFVSLLFVKVFHWLSQDRVELVRDNTAAEPR